jgi:hypothetical protein
MKKLIASTFALTLGLAGTALAQEGEGIFHPEMETEQQEGLAPAPSPVTPGAEQEGVVPEEDYEMQEQEGVVPQDEHMQHDTQEGLAPQDQEMQEDEY